MSKQQTAVEWVLQYLNNVKPYEFCSIEKIKELLELAKKIEKEQIIDAWNIGLCVQDTNDVCAEYYFNDTYNTNHE